MINPEEVVRDEYGFWTHSQYPEFETEYPPAGEWEKWCNDNGIKPLFVAFDGDAPEELQAGWFEDGLCDCTKWNPTPPADNAFLLSIHDTEDGPYAIFAVPLEGKAA